MKRVGIVAAALLVIVWASFSTDEDRPGPSRVSTKPAEVAPARQALAPRDAELGHRPAATGSSVRSVSESPSLVVKDLRRDMDYRAFVDRALRIGSGAYLVIARQAIDRCYPVKDGGMAGAERRFVQRLHEDDPNYQLRLDAYRGLMAPCSGFELRPVTQQEILSLQQRIDGLRDDMAKADAIMRGRVDPEGSRKIARSLVESGDTVLVQAVGVFLERQRMAEIKVARSDDPRIRHSRIQQRAWQLAACDLGDICGPNDALTRSRCAFQGLCQEAAADEALQEEKNQIVAAIQNRDWERLGL
jgi:hypothetical protein